MFWTGIERTCKMKKFSQGIASTLMKTTILRTLLWGLFVTFGLLNASELMAQNPAISVETRAHQVPLDGYQKGDIIPLQIFIKNGETPVTDYVSLGNGNVPSEFILSIEDKNDPEVPRKEFRLRYILVEGISTLQYNLNGIDLWGALPNGFLDCAVTGELANTIVIKLENVATPLIQTTNATLSTVSLEFERKVFVEKNEDFDQITDSPLVSIQPVNPIFEQGYWETDKIDFILSINDTIVMDPSKSFILRSNNLNIGTYRFNNKILYNNIDGTWEPVKDNKITISMNDRQTKLLSLFKDANISDYVLSSQTYTLNYLSRAGRGQLFVAKDVRGTGTGNNFENAAKFQIQNVINMGAIDIYLAPGEYSLADAGGAMWNGFWFGNGTRVYGGYSGSETPENCSPALRKMRTPTSTKRGLSGFGMENEATFNCTSDFWLNGANGIGLMGNNYIDGVTVKNARIGAVDEINNWGMSTIKNCKFYDCGVMVGSSALTVEACVFYANGQSFPHEVDQAQIQCFNDLMGNEGTISFNNCIIATNKANANAFIDGNVTFNHCILTQNENNNVRFIALGSTVLFRNSVLFNHHNGTVFDGHNQVRITGENFYTDQVGLNAPQNAIRFTTEDARLAFVDPDDGAWTQTSDPTLMASSAVFNFMLTRSSILTNAAAPTPLAYDALGQPRSGTAPDVGCYETQLSTVANLPKLYIGSTTKSGTDIIKNCDGSSWEKALPNFMFEDVLKRKSVQELYISSGVFTLTKNEVNILERPLKIYGGFGGGEKTPEERGIPSLRIKDLGYFLQNTVIKTNSNRTVSMFEIKSNQVLFNGIGFSRVNNDLAIGRGGLFVLNNPGDNVFRNCFFDKTSTTQNGGGLYVAKETKNLLFENCTFNALNAIGSGGAIYTESQGNLTFDKCRFSGNTATVNGGAIATETSKNIIVKNSDILNAEEIINNVASKNGGFLYAGKDVQTVTLDTLLAKGTTNIANANRGGLVYVDSTITKLSLNNVSASNLNVNTLETDEGRGGVIASISNLVLDLNNCTFLDNKVFGIDGVGGVVFHVGDINATNMKNINGNGASNGSIFSTTGSISINGATQINNNRGPLLHSPTGSFEIKNVTEIKDNKNIDNTAGALLLNTVTTNIVFLENIGNYSGNGTVISNRGANVTIKNVIFDRNTTGAVPLIEANSIIAENMKCLNNTTETNLILADGNINISESSVFENNSLASSILTAVSVIAKNTRFIKNTATDGVGAIDASASIALSDCKFFSNRAKTYAVANTEGTFSATHCYFLNNHSEENQTISAKNTVNINNSLFAYNTSNGAVLFSEADADIINCTWTKNKNISSSGQFNTLNIPIGSTVKNTIVWGNVGGNSTSLQMPKEISLNCAIEGIVTNRENLTNDKNTIILNSIIKDDPRGPDFIAILEGDTGIGADSKRSIVTLENCKFALGQKSPCTNRGNNNYSSETTDLAGATRVKLLTIDIGANESNYQGIAFVKMQPDTGYYGVLGGHHSTLVLSDPENFPSENFIEVTKFKVAGATNENDYKEVFFAENELAGLKQYNFPEPQPNWHYEPQSLNYTILEADLTLDIQCKIGQMKFTPNDDVTVDELVTFDITTNRTAAQVVCTYAGETEKVGTGTHPGSITKALKSELNTFVFKATGANYKEITKTITIIAKPQTEGYVVVLNGISQGFKKKDDNITLALESAPKDRAIWTCTNDAITIYERNRVSNPLTFAMPNKRVVLEAQGRDFYVGETAMGTGDGYSHANRADSAALIAILDSASRLSVIDQTLTRTENFVYVDSGIYTNKDSDVAFKIPTYTKLIGTGNVLFCSSNNNYIFELADRAGLSNIKIDGKTNQYTGILSNTENAICRIDSVLAINCLTAISVSGKSTLKVNNSNIQVNKLALSVTDGILEATNCIIAHNQTNALKINGSNNFPRTKAILLHCTIANNTQTPLKSENQYSPIEVNNSILWDVNDITLPANYVTYTGCAIKTNTKLDKNIILTQEKGVDFITAPTSVDSINWSRYDWNLKPTSVCINRADGTKTGLLEKDINNNPRKAYVLPDIGAYEVDTKGISYAIFATDRVTYNAQEVKLTLVDDVDYPGKDEFVTFTPSIKDSGIYKDVTPIGKNWIYEKATVIVDSAPLKSFEINGAISEDATIPLSQLPITYTAKGIDNVNVLGDFKIIEVDGNPITDSTLIYPNIDSIFTYTFVPVNNYAPIINTFQIECVWAAVNYELHTVVHPIAYGKSLIDAVDTAYGIMPDGTKVYGTYSFRTDNIQPIGRRTYDFDFKPFIGKNQKPTLIGLEIVIEPKELTSQQNVDSFIVVDTQYIYGQKVNPKIYFLNGKDSIELAKNQYTIEYNYVGDIFPIFEPTEVNTYELIITNTDISNYKFTREKLDSCIIMPKLLEVEIEKTTVIYGNKPEVMSNMTGLAYSDTIPYTFVNNWQKDSAVGTYPNEFIFTPNGSTDSYTILFKGDSSLTIQSRAYSPEEIDIIIPENLSFDGTAKEVTVKSKNEALVLTANDYDITYDGSTTMARTIQYSVLFKNNFTGSASGSYTITLEPALISLSNLSQKYDGTYKKATINTVGNFESIMISYKLGDQLVSGNQGVIEPGNYTVQVIAKQAGNPNPMIKESLFEVYTTLNVVSFDTLSKTITEGDTVILVANLLDTPSTAISIPFIINSSIRNDMYTLSAKTFNFAKNVRTDSIILTALSDSRSNPDGNVNLILYAQNATIQSGKDVCSIIIKDNADHSLDPAPVLSELKFIDNQEVVMTSSVPVAHLKMLSDKNANVTLKFSSMSTGDLLCNGLAYDGGQGVTLEIKEGVNPITISFAQEKLKTLKKPITVSVKKISANDLKLTKISTDKTRKIIYINNAPIAMPDDVSVMFENQIQDSIFFDLLKNDQKYIDPTSSTLPGELLISSLNTYEIDKIKLSIVDQKRINAVFTDCDKNELTKGISIQLTYTVNQVGAGATEGTVNMTVALKRVKGAEVEIKGENITKKTTVITKYEDPFKKPSKDGSKTRSFKMKRTSDTAAMINANIKGFNNSVLSKAYAEGNFFADMFDSNDSNYYMTPHNSIEKKLLQVASIGSQMNDKPSKGKVAQDFGSWNLSPAENIQLGSKDSLILTYVSKGVIVDSIAFSDTIRASGNKTYAIISGDYFGSTPTAYLEYLADNGKIKKISLKVCKSISVKSETSGKTLKWSSKTTNFGNVGKGSKMILLWPAKASLDKLKHAYNTHGRIDLIINNVTFQTPVKNFQNNSQNIVK